MSAPGPAAQTARHIIEASRYLVLATADATGRPWSSPVYFAHIGFTEFYWVSSPDAAHSRNIAVRPEVGIAVFDHPRNPHRAAWHTRAYGLMAANPFGRSEAAFPDTKGSTDLVRLAKGDHLKLKYAILLHAGSATDAKTAERFAAFADE